MAANDFELIRPSEIFDYFYHIEGILYNKVDRWKARKDCIAGSLTSDGYLTISFKKKSSLKVHRIVWCLHTGSWPAPGMEIDHKDGNRSNNNPENLRAIPGRGNCQNSARRSDNTSGHTGVTWAAYTGRWRASIYHKGKRFNLGYFDSAEEAAKAHLSAKKSLHEYQPVPRVAQ